MEDKLLELKEEFCKWYCPSKAGIEDYDGYLLDQQFVCKVCQIKSFIDFIRDEIGGK